MRSASLFFLVIYILLGSSFIIYTAFFSEKVFINCDIKYNLCLSRLSLRFHLKNNNYCLVDRKICEAKKKN